MERAQQRDETVLLLTLALATYNVARSLLIPDDFHFGANVTVGVCVVVVAAGVGLGRGELGLARANCSEGLRVGLIAGASIVLVIGAVVAIGRTLSLSDDRVDVPFTEMMLRIAVVIPLGTVLVEELIFRGVLHALLRSRFGILRASFIGAALFGAWHLVPVWAAYGDVALLDARRLVHLAGTFAATFMAGLGFVWLRERADHLAAPIIAHTATNSATFLLVWIATS